MAIGCLWPLWRWGGRADVRECPSGGAGAGGLAPVHLRCEYRVDPLGIDAAQPRLSWIVTSQERGQKQTAYEVQVASSEAGIKVGQPDLWDSGQVQSAETTAIVYAGKPLASNQRCYWNVRVWDKDGKPSDWSAPATFSVGLLNPSDWKAEWIGYDKPREAAVEKSKSDPAKLVLPAPAHLGTRFQVQKPVRHATLYSTSLGIHDIYLNGKRVSDDYFNPGWTDYNKRVYYRAYDVTHQIVPLINSLEAILADGGTAAMWGSARCATTTANTPG